MSNYTKATNFATKDALTTGNPLKTLSGTELDDEFNAIQVANNTKANASNAALTGTPVAPTAATATDTTQIATTAFVQANDALQLNLSGGAMTGAITTNSTFDGRDVAADGVLATNAMPKSGGAFTGAVTTNSTIDGRDVAADGVLATNALPKSGGALTGAVTTNSTFDGVDIATRDGVLTSTTATAAAALPKAGGTMTGDTAHGDNVKSKYGTGDDLQIYHNGVNSYINSTTGSLYIRDSAGDIYIQAKNNENSIVANNDGSVQLYYDNAQKLATTATGVDVTGTVTADGLVVEANAPYIEISNTGENAGGIKMYDSGGAATQYFNLTYDSGSTNTVGFDTGASGEYTFSVNTAEKMRIDSSGNVGIGTSSPTGKLTVNSSASNEGVIRLGDHATYYGELSRINATDEVRLSSNGGSQNLTFHTANTERLRINSSGNVGIGTSSPASSVGSCVDATGPLLVGGHINSHQTNKSVIENNSNNMKLRAYGATSGTGYMTFNTGGGGDAADAEAMRIDAAGNVGIGVVPTSGWHSDHVALQLGGGKDGFISSPKGQNIGRMFVGSNCHSTTNDGATGGTGWVRNGDTYRPSLMAMQNGNISFYTAAAGSGGISWTTAMTIDNSGFITLAPNTSMSSGGVLNLRRNDNNRIIETMSFDASTQHHHVFENNSGTAVGTITVSTSATAYNTSSDYRLKTDVQPMTGATDRVKLLKPCNFEWISDGTRVDGFLAHEAQEIVPEAATGTKDAMRDEEYEVTPATGDVFTAAIAEVTTESQVMETVETGSYVNLAGETIVETTEQGVTTELIETVVQRQDVDGVSTEVEVQVTTQVPTMETVITTEAVAEVIHSADVEKPETLEEGQEWRETTAAVMGTRSVPDMQGIDQAKLVPLLTATIQELIARIEVLEGGE